MDEKVTPLFAHKEPGGRYQNHEIVAFTKLSPTRLRDWQRERLIHVRGHGSRDANLAAPSDIAAFVALSALADNIGAKFEVLQAASLGLYAWQPEQIAKKHHPITHAIYGAANDEWWIWQIYSLVNDQTGEKITRAFCFDMDDTPRLFREPLSPWIPISKTIVNLPPLFKPLVGAIRQHAKAGRRLDA